MKSEFFFTVVSEKELNELLEGREAGIPTIWKPPTKQRIRLGSIGIVWKKQQNAKGVRPLIIIVHETELLRLYERFAQLRSDLAPLTAWCHVITPERFKYLDEAVRIPNLGEMEAAWTGLIVAEAQILSERSITNIRIPACFATQTFAVARTIALWSEFSFDDILDRYVSINRLIRSKALDDDKNGVTKHSARLLPIWSSLAAVSGSDRVTSELRPIVESLRVLKDARNTQDENEASRFVAPLVDLIPEVRAFEKLNEMTPERRVQQFDRLIDSLDMAEANKETARCVALTLVSGYLATVAAGGSPSLSLAEGFVGRWPEIMAWAYTIGGIGETVVWASGFDGLGRLVARELMRPFRFDEPPNCDFAYDEGAILVDKDLSDPLVHLKIKQARILSVALLPGVNIFVPISDVSTPEIRRGGTEGINRPIQEPTTIPASGPDLVAMLADAIWPHLENRVKASINNSKSQQTKPRTGSKRRNRRKNDPQERLSLDK